jgi:hypothetical protein
MYTWKYHNETPYIVILNKKCLFSKIEKRKVKTSLVWELVPVGGERI